MFEGELRSINKLTGEIDLNGVRTGDTVVGYFAYLELTTGFRKTLYMTVEQMAAHAKKYSKSIKNEVKVTDLIPLAQILTPTGDGVGWMANFNGMAEKTVTRNLLSKYGYLSTELSQAISYDINSDRKVEDADYVDVTDQKMIGFSDDNGNTYTMVGGSGNNTSHGGDGSATGTVDAASATANNEPDPGF